MFSNCRQPQVSGLLAIGVLLGALLLGNPFRRTAEAAPGGAAAGADVQPPSVETTPISHTSAALRLPSVVQPDEKTAEQTREDEASVGPCPRQPLTSPVTRSGIDQDGWPTWWHEDGSVTKRVRQTERDPFSGKVVSVAWRVVVARPGQRPPGHTEAR
jgi:hypothetical protein